MRRTKGLALLLFAGALLGVRSCFFVDGGPYRGGSEAAHEATGRFRVEKVDGIWWLVTPDGRPFFSSGFNNVNSSPDSEPSTGRRPYHENVIASLGSEEAWADRVLDRLDAMGFNTVGAWSQLQHFQGRFPYTQIMSFSGRAPSIPGSGGGRSSAHRDYFHPSFESGAASHAEGARGCAADPYCIGIFSDNEVGWGPSFTQSTPFIDGYMKLPAGAPGKLALQAFFEERHAGDIAAFNAAWGTALASFDEIQVMDALSDAPWQDGSAATQADRRAFRGRVAERYYRVVHDAMHQMDDGVLLLGDRHLAWTAAPDVVLAAAPYVDVISVNAYRWNEGWLAVAQGIARASGLILAEKLFDDVDEIHRLTGKPILISEFGFRASDSGHANSWPPVYPVFASQEERADAYQEYLEAVLARPFIVGAHFFEYADQPYAGRFDGEDNNWGIVSLTDELYPVMALCMWAMHTSLYATRRSAPR